MQQMMSGNMAPMMGMMMGMMNNMGGGGGGKGGGGGFGGCGGCGGGGKGMGKKPEPAKKVRVEGLPPEIQWQDLKDFMRQAGSVEFCNVTNGVGEVRYNTIAEAKKAVTMFNG